MSDVGDLLELLYGAGDAWITLQATVRTWDDTAVGSRALERWRESEQQGSSVQFQVAGSDTRPAVQEHAQRIWIAKPDRWRQEHEEHVAVGRGALWWSQSPYNGFLSNEDDPEHGFSSPVEQHAAHLAPVQLIPGLRFVSIDRGDVVVARAQPRPARGFMPGLSLGADEHVLTLDPERGVVLRIESFLGGERFHVSELVDPVWDAEIDEGVFALTPPPGEVARSPRDMHERLTVEEAARRASFAVFAIGRMPEGRWRVDAHFHAAFRERPEAVHLLYFRDDARGHIAVAEYPGRPDRWAAAEGVARAETERDGTFVVLSSQTHDEGVLRELAEDLVRV